MRVVKTMHHDGYAPEGRRPVCETSAQPGRAGCGDGMIERRRAQHSHALEQFQATCSTSNLCDVRVRCEMRSECRASGAPVLSLSTPALPGWADVLQLGLRPLGVNRTSELCESQSGGHPGFNRANQAPNPN